MKKNYELALLSVIAGAAVIYIWDFFRPYQWKKIEKTAPSAARIYRKSLAKTRAEKAQMKAD